MDRRTILGEKGPSGRRRLWSFTVRVKRDEPKAVMRGAVLGGGVRKADARLVWAAAETGEEENAAVRLLLRGFWPTGETFETAEEERACLETFMSDGDRLEKFLKQGRQRKAREMVRLRRTELELRKEERERQLLRLCGLDSDDESDF